MATIAWTITPTSTIMTRRTPTQSRRQQQLQLITTRANPAVRAKENAISDTVFNVNFPWCHCL